MSAGRIEADWLGNPDLQAILAALSAGGEHARIVGGAVRNTLLGQPVTDIDVATTCLPNESAQRLEAAGFKAVDTGMEHGTVTAVAHHTGFEVTTLREDIDTDGRHAVVRFGKSWQHDAERRDFTINALYAEADGTIVDLVGGRDDIAHARLRFIGDAEARIREDYLRILRFFRFFAWYGKGRPDADGLKACARLKDGLAGLSAERIWTEMRKLLAAPDPSRALLWMRQAGVLSAVLPESEKWGIDGIHGLMAAERALDWPPDPVVRLLTLIPPREETALAISARWKVANLVRDRLVTAVQAPQVDGGLDMPVFERLLYENKIQAVTDRLRIDIARLGAESDQGVELTGLLDHADAWKRPEFPLSGRDMIPLGHAPGPSMGAALADLEMRWIESGFTLTRDALLELAREKA